MSRDPIAEIERARSALMFLDAGTDHNTWVKAAMGAKAAGLDFEDFHDWSARARNYRNEAECRSVWRSHQGRRYRRRFAVPCCARRRLD
jgi:hypothetical protein